MRHIPLDRVIPGEAVVDNRGALGRVEQSGANSNQSAGGNHETAELIFAPQPHFLQITPPRTDHFHDRADLIHRDLDRQGRLGRDRRRRFGAHL